MHREEEKSRPHKVQWETQLIGARTASVGAAVGVNYLA